MLCDLYIRRARAWRLIDGDTLDAVVDLGYGMATEQRLRLLDVWAPEIRGAEREAGLRAMSAVHGWLIRDGGWASGGGMQDRYGRIEHVECVGGWPLLIRTEPDPDSFRRYLAVVWSASVEGPSLNDWLISQGFASATKGAA